MEWEGDSDEVEYTGRKKKPIMVMNNITALLLIVIGNQMFSPQTSF